MLGTYELRMGCYVAGSGDDNRSFRFMWVMPSVLSTDVDLADIKLPHPSDKFNLVLSNADGGTVYEDEFTVDDQYGIDLFGASRRVLITKAKPGSYTITVEQIRVEYTAGEDDDETKIRDQLLGGLKAKVEDPISVEAVDQRSIGLRRKDVQPLEGLEVSGPGDGDAVGITATPAITAVASERKTAEEILSELYDEVDRDSILAAARGLLTDQLALSPNLYTNNGQVIDQWIDAFLPSFYTTVSESFFGAATLQQDRRLVVDGATKGTFFPRFVAALELAEKALPLIGRVGTEITHYDIVSRLQPALVPLTTLISERQETLKQITMAVAAGTELDCFSSGGTVLRLPLGELFAVQSPIFDATSYWDEESGSFAKITAKLTWTHNGEVVENTHHPPHHTDCFNNALEQGAESYPEAMYVEDGKIILRLQDGAETRQFEASTGDGKVAIKVTNIGSDYRHKSFALVRTTGGQVPPSWVTLDPKPKVHSKLDPEEARRHAPDTLWISGDPAISTDRTEEVPDYRETLMVYSDKPTGEVVVLTPQELIALQLPEDRIDEIDGHALQLAREKAIPFGRDFRYFVYAQTTGGHWEGPYPVKRSSESPLTPPEPVDPHEIRILSSHPPTPPSLREHVPIALTPLGQTGKYRASLHFDNLQGPAWEGDLPMRSMEAEKIVRLHALLFRRSPTVDVSAVTNGTISASYLAADPLAYFSTQSWFVEPQADRWQFLGHSVFDGFDPAADERIEFPYDGPDHEGAAGGALLGGWEYLAITVAERDPALCYKVALGARFPVCELRESPDGLAILRSTEIRPAESIGVDSRSTTDPEVFRFEFSDPAIAPVAYAQATNIPPSPTFIHG